MNPFARTFLSFLAVATLVLQGGEILAQSNLPEAEQQVREMAVSAANERQRRYLNSAADAIAKASEELGKDPLDKEATQKALKSALIVLVEAGRECASIKTPASILAEALKTQGGLHEIGQSRIGQLIDLLDKSKAAAASLENGGMGSGMATREIIIGIYRILDNGFHDELHTEKAFRWYLNALIRAYWAFGDEDRAIVRSMLSELLDYLVANEGISSVDKAAVMEKIDELNDKVKAGEDDDLVSELREVKEDLRVRMRAASEARKQRYREEAEAEEARERAEEEALRQQEQEEEHERVREEALTFLAQPVQPESPPATTNYVEFPSLEGRTEVNRLAIGALHGVYFYGVDGERVEPSETDVTFQEHAQAITLDFPETPALASVVLFGSAGVIELLQDDRPLPERAGLTPRDGVIDIHNGHVWETVSATSPEGEGLVTGPIEDYHLAVDGQPVEIIAAQPDALGVESMGITGNPDGVSSIVLSAGPAVVASGNADSWGYNISVAEATETGVWVPIFIELYGVELHQLATVTFEPAPGQQIEPLSTVVTGAEAQVPAPIAQVMTEQVGLQQFFVDVVLEGGQQ